MRVPKAPQPARNDMRMVLSYACGYWPIPMRGSRKMDVAIHVVKSNEVWGFTVQDVLIMCQDLGCTALMTHLLQHLHLQCHL